MTEPTVTMTLTRFRELESAENAIIALKSDVRYYVYRSWDKQYFVNSQDQASIDVIEDMARLKNEMEDVMRRNRELKDGKR